MTGADNRVGFKRLSASALFTLTSLIVLGAWLIISAQRLIVSDWLAMEPRYRIGLWAAGKGPWSMDQWSAMQGKLRRALEVDADNPVLHDYLGALYALQGRKYWRSEALRRGFFLDARRHQEASLRLRQVNGRTWASLALSQYALGAPQERFLHAVRQARYHAPHDPQVHKLVVPLLLSSRQSIPADLDGWIISLCANPITNRNGWIDRLLAEAGEK